MTITLDELRAFLFAAKDGGDACDAINELGKRAKKGSEQAKKVLADYVCNGSINHMRDHPDDIQSIKARWDLPSTYLDFLTRFSPIKVTIESRRFYNHFQLFGAGELIEAQEGYSVDPKERQPIDDWPAHLVVIASHGGDPYVLDLSKSDGKDAPVDTAEHGTGVWEFNRVANSFREFLETLAK